MELCQDPQLRSLWPPAAMVTMPIQSEESFCCGIVGCTQERASAFVQFETENGREETNRQEGIRFSIYTQVGRVFWGFSSIHLLEIEGSLLESNCLLSLRFGRKHLLVGLFFLRCLRTSQPSPLCFGFLILLFIFPKCFVVFTKQNVLSCKLMTLGKKTWDPFSDFNVCNIIIVFWSWKRLWRL